jgi:cation diffusion facilitator family transporter
LTTTTGQDVLQKNLSNSDRDRCVRKVTWCGLSANVFLAVFKIIAGIIGYSQALVADGVHSASDMAGDLMILVGARFWSKPADSCHPHGHQRLETVVAFVIGVLLVITALGMLINAGHNLLIENPRPGRIAVAAAFASLVLKEALYQYTIRHGRRIRSLALQANAWHHRTDAMSSAPVLIAIVVIRIKPEWSFLDPIAAIAVVFFIIYAGYRIVKPSIQKLIDAGASSQTIDQIRNTVKSVQGVADTHNIRTRYVGDSRLSVDLHVQVNGNITVRAGHAIGHDVRNHLITEFSDIIDVVVHVEPTAD